MTRMASVLVAATLALLGPLAGLALAKTVHMENLPPAVQNTIRNQVGTGQIHEIEQEEKNGKIYYEVEWVTRDGVKSEIKVRPDGNIIKPGTDMK